MHQRHGDNETSDSEGQVGMGRQDLYNNVYTLTDRTANVHTDSMIYGRRQHQTACINDWLLL